MEIRHQNRRAFVLENADLQVVIMAEGGHVAQVLHKPTGINPLWTPPWPSIEHSAYSPTAHPEYGTSPESLLLSGILGHSLCLDTYGAPSAEEAQAGIPIHGEGPVVRYDIQEQGPATLLMTAILPLVQIRFTRRLSVAGDVVRFDEAVENLTASDRPIGWTQHVTLGPPFVEHGQTEFRMPATRSRVIDQDFGGSLKRGAEFEWPLCPRKDHGVEDLRRYSSQTPSAGFTTHLIDPQREQGYFVAWHPRSQLAFGYAWKRSDFPWVCRWEENGTRTVPPWNGRTVTCAMEFGVSPVIESRRDMVGRASLFGHPAYRWLPARSTIRVSYCAFARQAGDPPASAEWNEAGNEDDKVRLT